jgi:rubredoxin
MPEPSAGRVAAKANQLYWNTNRPAGRLADQLGISRSKFYGLIEPLALDATCPECGAGLVFTSRSEREAGRGRCPACGGVTDLSSGAEAAVAPPAAPAELDELRATPAHPGPWLGAPELWVAALCGALAGALIATWWRRR